MKTINVQITFSDGAWASDIDATVRLIDSLPVVAYAELIK